MSVDLALVFPRMKYPSGDPPLGVASIAAFVREQGYRVAIVDATWHPSEQWVLDEIERLDPDFVGIYTSTLMLNDAKSIGSKIKLRSAISGRKRKVMIGGPHFSAMPDHGGDFSYCDVVTRGEGEYTVVNIMRSYYDFNNPVDLATLPAPALDLLDMDRYMDRWHYLDSIQMGMRGTNLMAHRGCPFCCTYCQPTVNRLFGSTIRSRTPQQVVDEMEELHDRYGIDGFFFHDDTLTIKHDWLGEFLRLLGQMSFYPLWGCNSRVNTVDEDLLWAMVVGGCRAIHWGIEAGSQRVLDEIYNKGIKIEQVRQTLAMSRRFRIHNGGFFILGAPGETRQEMQITVDLACKLPLDEASFSICVPLPGTTLYERMASEGRVFSGDPLDYDYYQRQPFEHDVPLVEIKALQRKALIRFYGQRKGYLLRHLTSWRGVKRLAQKVGRFL